MPQLPHWQVGRAHKAKIRFGLAIAQMVHDFIFFEQYTKRNHHRSGLQNAEIDDRKIRQIETAEGHFIARLDAFTFEPIGHLVGCAIDLGKTQGGITKDECSFVGKTARAVF